MAAQEPTTSEERVPLGALLIAEGLLNEVQLHQALHLGSQTGERLGEIVVRQGFASEEDVARLLAEQWDLGYVDRASIWFDANALARLSREDAQRLEAMPTRVEDGRVVVAVAEPTEERLAALREVIGEDTVVVVVPKAALEAGLHSELLKSNGQPVEKSEAEPEPDAGLDEAEAPPPAPEGAPPLELVTVEPDEPDDAPDGDGLSSEDDDLAAAIAVELPAYKQAKPAETPTARPRAAAPVRPSAAAPSGGLAEGIAQLIEAQIGAAAAPAAEAQKKLVELERRIKQLEKELGANRAALAELGKHLKTLAGVLSKL
jgi:hypothetical protein